MKRVEASARMLQEAVAALYDVFAGYPLRDWTDPCSHCYTADDEAVLHRAPLRELAAEDLRWYAADSLMLWGDLGDLKHPADTGRRAQLERVPRRRSADRPVRYRPTRPATGDILADR